MQTLEVRINEVIKTLNPYYLKEVYDFASYLEAKQRKESDTEYLNTPSNRHDPTHPSEMLNNQYPLTPAYQMEKNLR